MVDLANSIFSSFVGFAKVSIAEKTGRYRSFRPTRSTFVGVAPVHAIADEARKNYNSHDDGRAR
jgi:hypothetical protein